MFCHRQGIAIPLSLFFCNRNDARLLVMNIVALELVKCHRNGCINFVFHTQKIMITLEYYHAS